MNDELTAQCNCRDLPDCFGMEVSAPAFEHLDLLAEKEDGFRVLYRCRICGQHWQLDDWDIVKIQLAFKVADPKGWINFDDRSIRMTYLVNSRGGLADEECSYPGCGSKRVSGLELCAFHATRM